MRQNAAFSKEVAFRLFNVGFTQFHFSNMIQLCIRQDTKWKIQSLDSNNKKGESRKS